MTVRKNMYHNFCMRTKAVLFPLIALLLTGCTGSFEETKDYGSYPSSTTTSETTSEESSSGSSSSSSSSEEPPEGEPYIKDIESVQDTTILHAWNWRLSDVKSRLRAIKAAGYKSIQISPMQPRLDKTNYTQYSTKDQWWKVYQPLDFKVAQSNENYIGTKSELTSLCSEANSYGINIVVDIVSNHLAGSNGVYDSQVYTQYPLHDYEGNANDSTIRAVTQGRVGGLPDVDTSTTQVQTAVLNMLKEYIDCGIKGFRFDTAKHIETPNDGQYASSFWTTVLGGTTSYSVAQGKGTPYYYGEILGPAGGNRPYSSYTSMMSITDNQSGQKVLNSIKSGSTSNLTNNYPTGENASKLMLWAESHDTYANDDKETTEVSQSLINKAFVIQNTRKDAASLYLARPESWSTQLGVVNTDGWTDDEIVASNWFHQIYNRKSESRSINGTCYVNVRGQGNYAGAAIVNTGSSSSVSLSIDGLAKQNYTDLASGRTYAVGNNALSLQLTNGCALLVPTFLLDEIEIPTDDSYSSSIVITGADSNKNYFVWKWNSSDAGSWKAFNSDKDALGVDLSTNDNYIIVETNKSTTISNINWSSVLRQTNDLVYNGTQVIYAYNSIVWKT